LLEKMNVRLQDERVVGGICSVSEEAIEKKHVNGNNKNCESLDIDMCESVSHCSNDGSLLVTGVE